MGTQLPLFSIVTVCLNPGQDLAKTVGSILAQDYRPFESVIKDGLSQDGTQDFACSDPRVTFVSQADGGIYDAMNQALDLCRGRYVNFLNAGDTFRVRHALSRVADLLEEHAYPDMVYVDRYNEKLDAVTHYPPSLSPWYLFRRPVCHQALFVKRSLLLCVGGFDTTFRIFADYDVLMKLVLAKKASHVHCPLVAVSYKDDGVSSAPRNRRQKLNELQRLREAHFTRTQRLLYGIIWRGTLPGIRIRLVHQDRIRCLRRVLCR
jgi:glycosyltransferase involved in cell wall biosynthesis